MDVLEIDLPRAVFAGDADLLSCSSHRGGSTDDEGVVADREELLRSSIHVGSPSMGDRIGLKSLGTVRDLAPRPPNPKLDTNGQEKRTSLCLNLIDLPLTSISFTLFTSCG